MHLPNHFLFLKNRELNELYASMAIRSFANSMIAIFIPIYLIQVGYPLATVFIYYAMRSVFHSIFSPAAAKFASKYGFKHAILLSVLPAVAFFYILGTLETQDWPLWSLAIASGLATAMFWMGYHSNFSMWSNQENRGSAVAFGNTVAKSFTVVGPAIGGLLLATTGFNVLFFVVILLMFVSTIPLFLSPDVHEPIDFSFGDVFKDQSIGDYFALVGHSIHLNVALVIWPIFIFFEILNDFTQLGLITTVTLVFSMAITIIAGIATDGRRKLVLRISSILNSLIWIIKVFVTTTLQVYIVDAFHGMARTAATNSFDAMNYDKANRKSIIETILFREMINPLGGAALFLIMAFTLKLTTGFYIGAFASLLYLLF